MKQLILLKLGGSVITDKSKPFTVDHNNLDRLAKEISNAYNSSDFSLILVHGAGSYGHTIAMKYSIAEGIKTERQVFGFAETQKAMEDLNNIVVDALQKENLPAIHCQASSHAVMKSGKLQYMSLDAIKGFLKLGLIPVLYGVPAYDETQRSSILSGDEIATYLAKKLKAKRVIYGIDKEGVLDKDNKTIKEITPKKLEEIKRYVSGSTAVDVTGGMLGKLEKVLMLSGTGMGVELVNATKPRIIEKCLKGKKGLGTSIKI